MFVWGCRWTPYALAHSLWRDSRLSLQLARTSPASRTETLVPYRAGAVGINLSAPMSQPTVWGRDSHLANLSVLNQPALYRSGECGTLSADHPSGLPRWCPNSLTFLSHRSHRRTASADILCASRFCSDSTTT